MGNIDFNSFQNTLQNRRSNNYSNQNTNGKPRVGFFSLKNDKDYAIVRFMIDKPEDFDIVAGHRMNVNGYSRMVSCIRDAHDPVDNCPLCSADKKLEYKFYIHLIQYVQDVNGNLVPTPKVWERSTVYVNTFNNYLNDYGPLSDCLFKVTRNGSAGSTKTTYDISFIPTNSPVYRPENYVKDTSLFEGYKAVGNAVLNYNAEKMLELLSGADTAPTTPVTPRTNIGTGFGTPAPQPQQPTYSVGSGYGSGGASTVAYGTTPQVPQTPVTPAAPEYNQNRRFVPPVGDSAVGTGVNRPVRTY